MNIAAVIPCLNPDEKLLEVVKGLAGAGLPVFLVDDGSGPDFAPIFRTAAAQPGCTLLRHPVNRGKGRALKTAFSAVLGSRPDCMGVVTADADGQHKIEDVLRCAHTLARHPGELILGARDFSGPDIPRRSAFGNRLTRGVFRYLCGLRVADTQTGLRGIPADFCRTLLEVPGERYEFETNMLLETAKRRVSIRELPIRTIYMEKNASSHFNPLRDSLRIYGQIIKFLSSALLSFLVDLTLFVLLYRTLSAWAERERVFAATAGARALSSLLNFWVNRSLVFAGRQRWKDAMTRYYLLCAGQMLASFAGVYLLSTLLLPSPALSKIMVDTLLMLLSFSIQRAWVFRG